MTKAVSYPWHEEAWTKVSTMHQLDRLPHAILLTGLAGLGKRAFAERLSTALLCKTPDQDFNACGQCQSCKLFQADAHPDHTVIEPDEPGKAIKVDQIRALKAAQSLMPKIGHAKTVIIDHADSMNINAFNSLLKLLEEPQANTTLILVVSERARLPITITSRCQQLTLLSPSDETGLRWLNDLNPSLTEDRASTLLQLAQGAPLKALTLAEEDLSAISQLSADIKALIRGHLQPIELAPKWVETDTLLILRQFQQMVQSRIQQHLLETSVTPAMSLSAYWHVADCIKETIKLISSSNNLNKTLLIEDFLLQVRTKMTNDSTRHSGKTYG